MEQETKRGVEGREVGDEGKRDGGGIEEAGRKGKKKRSIRRKKGENWKVEGRGTIKKLIAAGLCSKRDRRRVKGMERRKLLQQKEEKNGKHLEDEEI